MRRFGADWQFRVAHDGTTGGFAPPADGGESAADGAGQPAAALVFLVRQDKVLSFTRGVAVQTRYRFPHRASVGEAG